MAEENLKTVETVDTRPFRKLVMTIGELPTSFIESMTYYELLAWFTNYLETVIIPTVNNNGEAVEELQQKYIELKANTEEEIEDFETSMTTLFNELKSFVDNYFDNLDVQEEINNKLDQMAEDGVLQEIVANYLNSQAVFGYDTVADMIQATNLQNGSYAHTRGYYNINDMGGASYAIKTTSTSLFAITLNNGLYAEPIMQESMNILQFGIRGSDAPYTPKIQAAIDSCNNLTFNKETYTINDFLTLHNNSHLDLNGANINFSVRYGFKNLKSTDTTLGYNGNSNITIENGKITGGSLALGHGKNITVKNIEFIDCLNDHWVEISGCQNVKIENNYFGGRPNASGGGFTSNNFSIINLDPMLAAAFPHYETDSASYDGTLCENIYILNNVMDPLSHIDSSITSCRTLDAHYEATEINNHKNVVVSGNTINGIGGYLNVAYHIDNLDFNNNVITPKSACPLLALGFTNYAKIHDNSFCLPLDSSNPSSPITIRANRPNLKISYHSNSYEHLPGTSSLAELYFENDSTYSFIKLDLVRAWTGTQAPAEDISFPLDYTKFNHMYLEIGTGGNLKCVDFKAYHTRFFQTGDTLRAPVIDGRIGLTLAAENKYTFVNTSTTDTGNNANLRVILVGVD